MTTEKRRGRPKGSKNKVKEQKVVTTQEIQIDDRPYRRRKNPILTDEINLDMRSVWEHMRTGTANYVNLVKNLELHKEDIPIFAEKYRTSHKRPPGYVIIHPRNSHLIRYIKKEFPDIGVGGSNGTALWELMFCVS